MMRSFILTLLIFLCSFQLANASWEKYISGDGSFSLHYPKGWNIKTEQSIIEITNPSKDEQILFFALPFDEKKSSADLANDMIAVIKENTPGYKASNMKTGEEGNISVSYFDIAYPSNGKNYLGNGIVMKYTDADVAYWFSFAGPSKGYSSTRGVSLLQGLISSLAHGADSKPPTDEAMDDRQAAPASKLSLDRIQKNDKNAQAFLFVLEFALGAPLTQSQENVILTELKKEWNTMTEEELKPFDVYPGIVQAIMTLGQNELEKLRKDLEKDTREWLAETDTSNQTVRIVQAKLNEKGKIIIKGDPPLTEMAAAAYSEIFAYSELLQKNPNATPDQISLTTVAEIRNQLLKEWSRFTKNDRERIATAPGLWVATRALLRYSSKEEQGQIKAKLAMLTASVAPQNAQTPIQKKAQKNVVTKGKIGCDEYLKMTSEQREQVEKSGGTSHWTKQDWERCRQESSERHQSYMAVSTMMYNEHVHKSVAMANAFSSGPDRYEVRERGGW